LNFAGVFRVPCVFICQNNQWAISTPTTRQTASRTIAIKARAYGIPGVRVDGNDPLAVYRVVDEARRRAVSSGGPTFIECLTYRMGAHSTSDDPTRYQPSDELDRWQKRDPIARLRRHLQFLRLIDAEGDRRLDEQLHAEIAAAISDAEKKPKPALRTLFDDVYASRPWNIEEQSAMLRGE
jgi:pyruvate dehydrogenase E1 component alpha subunit/2-oxoisovalerate dehydrogenase E1 component alpha subunit